MATKYIFSNNATTTLAESISATSTVLNLASGTGSLFPSPTTDEAFPITLVDAATGLTNEICYCTARSGDALTVTRGEEGTTALAWAAGDTAANYITAGTINAWLQASDLDGYATENYAKGTFVSGDTGYEIHPDGYIRQWGKYDSGSNGLATIIFPILFPNAAFGASVGENNALSTWTANRPVFHGHYGLSQNSMVVVTRGIDSTSSTGWGPQESTGDWEAWGN